MTNDPGESNYSISFCEILKIFQPAGSIIFVISWFVLCLFILFGLWLWYDAKNKSKQQHRVTTQNNQSFIQVGGTRFVRFNEGFGYTQVNSSVALRSEREIFLVPMTHRVPIPTIAAMDDSPPSYSQLQFHKARELPPPDYAAIKLSIDS